MTKPIAPRAFVVSPTGIPVFTASGAQLVLGTDPAQAHDRFTAAYLELDVSVCANTFGITPCTATGTKCYNTFSTCKDKPNFIQTVQTLKFCLRGMPAQPGQTARPYLTNIDIAPTEIQPGKGLAIRSRATCTLVDETDNDTELDPYVDTRAAVAGGTFWRRFQARHLYTFGRPARIRRGFLAEPYSEVYFEEQRFIIDSIAGPDSSGAIKITLADPIKLLEKAVIPAATDGKLVVEFPDTYFTGFIQSSTLTTVVLPNGASAINAEYDGMEIFITGGAGSGQRRVLSGYVGTTLTATVAAWNVLPDTTSQFEIVRLRIDVGSGNGAQYGDSGYFRISDEIIRFSSRSNDVLILTDGTYRAQFGTTRESHNFDKQVQLCKVWSSARVRDVVQELLEAGGIATQYIDTTMLAFEDETWLREVAYITTCRSKPETIINELSNLCEDLNLMVWWNPVAQLVQFKVNVPNISASGEAYTNDTMILKSVDISRMDGSRLTQTAQYYDIRSATDNERENKNYLRAEVRIDTEAQSDLEYADTRTDVQQSSWLSAANEIHVSALVARRLSYVRDAPYEIAFDIDRMTPVELGELADVTTDLLTDTEGNAKVSRCRILSVSEESDKREVVAQTTTFAGRRYAFIAPNGQANFGSATANEKRYAYICNASGLMSDGTAGYLII